MEIAIEAIKELRARTGAGVLDCRKALAEAQGDLEAAAALLRQRGLAEVAKRADREARDGRIEVYAHPGNRVAAMVELNCETDFVARTEAFIHLAHELVLQVTATNPRFVSREEVPASVIEEERESYRREIEGNKPPHVVEKIIAGKLEKFYGEVCLLEQPLIRDAERTVKDLVTEVAAQVGENVVVRRFARFELGA